MLDERVGSTMACTCGPTWWYPRRSVCLAAAGRRRL